MTDNDLIALVPWLIFATALVIICVRVHWLRHPSKHSSSKPGTPPPEQQPEADSAADPPSSGQVAGGDRRGARS